MVREFDLSDIDELDLSDIDEPTVKLGSDADLLLGPDLDGPSPRFEGDRFYREDAPRRVMSAKSLEAAADRHRADMRRRFNAQPRVEPGEARRAAVGPVRATTGRVGVSVARVSVALVVAAVMAVGVIARDEVSRLGKRRRKAKPWKAETLGGAVVWVSGWLVIGAGLARWDLPGARVGLVFAWVVAVFVIRDVWLRAERWLK